MTKDELQEIKNWIKADKYNIHAITEAEEMLTALLAHIAGLEADTPRRSFEHFKGAMEKLYGGISYDKRAGLLALNKTLIILTADDFEALGWDVRWLDEE